MSERWPLVRAISLRHLLAHRTRSALTILGVALGVAVVVAVDSASQVALVAFSESAEALAGRASLRLRVDGLWLEEAVLEKLAPLWEIARLDPTLLERGRVLDAAGEPFDILGINLLADSRLEAAAPRRAEGVAGRLAGPPDDDDGWLERMRDPSGIFIARRFADRHALAPGDSLRFHWGVNAATLRVLDVFPDDGAFLAFAGNTGVMDIAPFQERFGHVGRLSWIDLTPRAGVSAERLLDRTRAVVSDGYLLEPPSAAAARLQEMVGAYRTNMLALSGVALLVGVFLVYNTISSSILSRREEVATLRALGATRRQILGLLGGESALIGLAGALIGLWLAQLLARGTVSAVAGTVYRVYGAIRPEAPVIDAGAATLAVVIGLALSLIASVEPLWLAVRVRPLEFLRRRRPTRAPRDRRAALAGAALLGLAAVAARGGPLGGVPFFGYLAALLLMLGASLCLPLVMTILADATAGTARRLACTSARIAAARLRASVGRQAVAAAALTVAIGMVVGMGIMVYSFEGTVLAWAKQSLRADLWVGPQARASGTLEGTIDPSVADRLEGLPFVEAVDRFRGIELLVDGAPAYVGAGDSRVLADHGNLPLLGGRRASRVLPRLIGRPSVLVSEPFAQKRGTRAGDRITLPTPAGDVAFTVEAIYRDYSSDRGYVIMDRTTFLQHFRDPTLSTIAVYLRDGVAPDSARQAVLDAFEGESRLNVMTTGTLRAVVERTLRATFAVTYAVTAIGLIVALLAIATTLAVLVMEERRTIGVLKALGASAAQILRVVLCEALLLGAVGNLAGYAVGFSLAWILVFVINLQSFGWTLSYSIPWAGLIALFVAVPLVATMAGLLPARRAARLPAREAMSRD